MPRFRGSAHLPNDLRDWPTTVRTGRGSKLCVAATVLLMSNGAGLASERTDRGRSLLTEYCSSCHAVGRTGQSPLPAAPAFRRIGNRLDLNGLVDRMREGLSSAHKDMPTFRFSREDARAVRSYLNSIQE